MRFFINIIPFVVFISFMSQKISAKEIICPEKPGTALGVGGTTFSGKIEWIEPDFRMEGYLQYAKAILADCKSSIPNYKDNYEVVSKKASFVISPSSNIDMTQSLYVVDKPSTGQSGGTNHLVYKLKNTTSTVLNTIGYIAFDFGEGSVEYAGHTYFMNKAYNNPSKWNLPFKNDGKYSSPHAYLSISRVFVYFVGGSYPMSGSETVPIRLGTVETETTRINSSTGEQEIYKGKDDVYITVNYIRNESNQCTIDPVTVNLNPAYLRKDLQKVGDEAGSMPFQVNIKCRLPTTSADFSIGDNMDVSNYGDVLTNTVEETKSFGIRIRDLENSSKPILSFNKAYSLGSISSLSEVTRRFSASYYRKDNYEPTSQPGPVKAQAVMTIMYR